MAPYPLSPQAYSIAWTGSEMLAWDYELNSAIYDPAHDRWRRLPDLPVRFAECYPASVEAGATGTTACSSRAYAPSWRRSGVGRQERERPAMERFDGAQVPLVEAEDALCPMAAGEDHK
jgi:hypothetical protein